MKKILIITVVAFIIVSILAIILTFQASSTFRNFSDDNGENGDDHFNLSDLNLIQDNYINFVEKCHSFYKDQKFTGNYRVNLPDSSFTTSVNKIEIQLIETKFSI
jgi:hypothetical protein